MKKFLAVVVLAFVYFSPVPLFAGTCETTACVMAQASTTTTTNTETPTAPASVTTVVKGGTIAADVLEWLKVILVPIIGSLLVGIAYKVMTFFGVKVEESNKSALQAIIVNGLNQAAMRAETQLKAMPELDVNVKNKIIADAIAYTQDHAKETIRALGLDAEDPKAVEAIRARIQTAIIDPLTPTNPMLEKLVDGKKV